MKWIKTIDEMPEEGEFVLTVNNSRYDILGVNVSKRVIWYDVLRYDYAEKEWIDAYGNTFPPCEFPTHWMKLPKPPKKRK